MTGGGRGLATTVCQPRRLSSTGVRSVWRQDRWGSGLVVRGVEGRERVDVGQAPSDGDEKDTDVAGEGRARPVGRRAPTLGGGEAPAVVPGGLGPVLPPVGGQLLEERGVRAHRTDSTPVS